MGEISAAYTGCRTRVGELTGHLDEERGATTVPTCREWSVHDLVAHVTGVVDDALAGRLDGVATDPWTAAQVDARRSRSIPEILAEWDEKAPPFEGLLDAIGDPGRQAVTDVVTHEHDIRATLGQPGAKDSDAVGIGLGFVAPAFVDSAASYGISVRVRTTDGVDFGSHDADMTLRGDAFELLRAMTGRRSVAQLRDLNWEGDRELVIPAFTFGPFRPAADLILE